MVVDEEFQLCRGRIGEKCRGTGPTQLAQSFGAEVDNFLERRGEEVVSEVIPSKKGREWEELAGPLKAGGSVNRNSYEMMR